jgi:predicted Ser/Thr protein kinase
VLGDRLGEGGMGVVWSARDTALGRDVAIKLLHDQFLGAEHQQRLADEARTMAQLSHPNVVAVYDVGERDGRTFLAMELVRGEPLARWLATPRSWREVVTVFRGAAEGLAAAHAAGIVHRDIKPGNILVGDDGRPRVADFGVAHAGGAATNTSAPPAAETTGLIGSPAYMSIEQLCGEPADARSDQFALCITLHEALHGRRPFDAPTIGGLIIAITRGAATPIRRVPRWLQRIVQRGLALDPAARFPSMAALATALAGPRRHVRVAGIAAAVLAMAIVAIAVSTGEPAAGPVRAADPVRHPDAPVVQLAAISAPPDAAPAGGTIDAAAALPDAAADLPHPKRAAVPSPLPSGMPPPNMPTAALHARYDELLAAGQAAFKTGDFAKARQIFEQAIPYADGNVDAYAGAATSSCRSGEPGRARLLLARIPRRHTDTRVAVAISCGRVGVDLEDALDEYERSSKP